MPIAFAKAPLIELVAELRWIPQGSAVLQPGAGVQQGATPSIFIGGTKQEEFYMQLGVELYKLGFDRSERLLPPGVPFNLHQAVYRFRSEQEGITSVLYQVGYGIFSAHAVPPYHSWAEFLPHVVKGIHALLETRPESDKSQPFSQLSLRYIDFFGEKLTANRNTSSFFTEVLGISVKFPVAVSKVAASNDLRSLYTRAVLPLGFGDLTLIVGDGQFNNQPGILLDNTVSSIAETTPTQDAIMKLFESAHSVLHNIFLELTRPIHDLMEPQGEHAK